MLEGRRDKIFQRDLLDQAVVSLALEASMAWGQRGPALMLFSGWWILIIMPGATAWVSFPCSNSSWQFIFHVSLWLLLSSNSELPADMQMELFSPFLELCANVSVCVCCFSAPLPLSPPSSFLNVLSVAAGGSGICAAPVEEAHEEDVWKTSGCLCV